MAFKQLSLTVKSFHFDLTPQGGDATQDIQVAMRQVEPNDSTRKAALAQGHMFEVLVPFTIRPAGYGFQVAGEISLFVQTLDYFGAAQDLPQAELAQISQPAIAKIQSLTYDVTRSITGEGVQLNFQPATSR
ncbi:DUF1149 family protein [Lacticaseibacillus absianus]|uniref:DUF1149 family protein n=1 Tax=Lacticaseibacillus absianus TaxID=2729623 RepID=UPI0015C930E1|nr:DUF1149 family protein [Lacticaseibacillus absianus]